MLLEVDLRTVHTSSPLLRHTISCLWARSSPQSEREPLSALPEVSSHMRAVWLLLIVLDLTSGDSRQLGAEIIGNEARQNSKLREALGLNYFNGEYSWHQ